MLKFVRSLQRDGRLLLRHIARRSDTSLPWSAQASGGQLEHAPAILLADAQQLAESPDHLAALASQVDNLSRHAAPANVRSIRLTCAYLRMSPEGGEPSEDVRREAKRLKLTMNGVAAFSITVFLVAVALLAHVEDGRRAVQRLEAMRVEQLAIQRDMAALTLADTRPLAVPETAGPAAGAPAPAGSPAPATLPQPGEGFLLSCTPPASAAGAANAVHRRVPANERAAAVCGRFQDLGRRFDLTYVRLGTWNCRTHAVLTFGLGGCGSPSVPLPAGIDLEAWQNTELRVAGTMAVLTGFALPMLLGCLGGCAYALRRLDEKLLNWTLEPRDGKHSVLRVALAAILGGLVGVVWTADEPVHLGGFALSLSATAFFVGFSVEVVFKVIETVVSGVAATLRSSTAPQPLPTPVLPAQPQARSLGLPPRTGSGTAPAGTRNAPITAAEPAGAVQPAQ
ncbi:hypothetical protein [Roseomonas sp. BN140053]|uniref:hypothetical protein n=1 Tax=Roseomonas sp. BN140053 TaxID=3391898 RepID=UPI0039E8CFB5